VQIKYIYLNKNITKPQIHFAASYFCFWTVCS